MEPGKTQSQRRQQSEEMVSRKGTPVGTAPSSRECQSTKVRWPHVLFSDIQNVNLKTRNQIKRRYIYLGSNCNLGYIDLGGNPNSVSITVGRLRAFMEKRRLVKLLLRRVPWC